MTPEQLGAIHREEVLAATWSAWLENPQGMEWLK